MLLTYYNFTIAQQTATATMINANLRGNRFISKNIKVTDHFANGPPSNTLKIKATLKMLRSLKEIGVEAESLTDDDIQGDYDILKRLACKIRQELMLERQDLRGLSWLKLGEKEPSLKKQLGLNLEKLAFDRGISIHVCEDMWVADRLLFESFRGSMDRKKKTGGKKSLSSNSDNSDSGCNPANASSLPPPPSGAIDHQASK